MPNTSPVVIPTWAEARPITFPEAVFLRPKMYTIHGTVEEVAIFLHGFYSGMAAHTTDPRCHAEAQRWWGFCRWLQQHEFPHLFDDWYTLVQTLRTTYADDAQLFVQLLHWYAAFHRDQPDTSKA